MTPNTVNVNVEAQSLDPTDPTGTNPQLTIGSLAVQEPVAAEHPITTAHQTERPEADQQQLPAGDDSKSEQLVGSLPATTLHTPSTTSYEPQPRHDFPSQSPEVRKRPTRPHHSQSKQSDRKSGTPTDSGDLGLGVRPSIQGAANAQGIACNTITTEPMSTVAQSAEVNTHTGRPSSEQSRQKLTRPHLFRGATSHMESEYVHMVLALDDISVFYNIMAAFFTWILLAGFVLFPGTFANLQSAAAQHNLPTNSPIVLAAVNSITTLPLFVVASACAGMGIIGMLWLTWRWHKNYIWVLNKIFIPGLLNSLAGLLSTLANIYGTQKGEFSEPSRITLLVLICCSGVCLFLVVIYAFWLLRRIKSKHHVDVGVERSGKHGEGVTVDIEALKKKKNMREG